MSLSSNDLTQINELVMKAVSKLPTRDEIKSSIESPIASAVSGLATKADLDRMEGRLTTSIGLLQRDTFERLDQHEARISRLEKSLSK